jgi:histidine ammonia-lyase
MAAILNAGITPAVYEFGSLGCSGDLAPLAHCALVLMGEGEAVDSDGQISPAADALKAAGIEADRKILSDLAITDAAAFSAIVAKAKQALLETDDPLERLREVAPIIRIRGD